MQTSTRQTLDNIGTTVTLIALVLLGQLLLVLQ